MGKSKNIVIIVLVVLLSIALIITFALRQSYSEEKLNIAITQILEHPALDAARQGFIDVFEEHGYIEGDNVVYDIQNAQGEIANTNTIAQKFALDRPDLILAISTPSATALANAIEDIPIFITAVTDPVNAGIVESAEKPNTNVTGTTDMNPIKDQLELLLEISPEVSRVGVIYNAGESNSVVQVNVLRQVAQELGLDIVDTSISASTEVLTAAKSLSGRVDAIYVPTDNTVISTIESVVGVAENNNIPLIVGEEHVIERGALATLSINYYRLGRQTAEMALEVLEGESIPQEMAIQSQREYSLILNTDAAEGMGIVFSDELLNRADTIYPSN
ncbi:ABC transporter substrate-binding protein [Natronospora cellulosivora (SeqCode)]